MIFWFIIISRIKGRNYYNYRFLNWIFTGIFFDVAFRGKIAVPKYLDVGQSEIRQTYNMMDLSYISWEIHDALALKCTENPRFR